MASASSSATIGRGAASGGRTGASARGAAPAFEARRLRKHYRLERHDIHVLADVNLRIKAGEWVALVGRSGSGKTTLLHLLGSLDKPTDGQVLCCGRDYATLSRRQKAQMRRDEIGFVFQSYHLFPELTAQENVVLPALQWGWNRRTARSRASDLLAEFGLADRLRHRPQELSGGEQQRVALARALINAPAIILADEPTGNLDVTASGEIMSILQRLHAEQGKTIVMVTHDLGLAKLADRALLIKEGAAVPFDSAPTPA